MQTVSSRFLTRINGRMRPLNWSVLMSLTRELDPSATFFTVGVSAVGGGDIIMGTDDVIQIWDQYNYTDYSDRVVSLEWSQTLNPQNSVQSAIGTLVLDNHDHYFGADNVAYPFRPVRISVGFGNDLTGYAELLPQFVGLTSAPVLDETAKTVTYQLSDFLQSLYNEPLTTAAALQNVRTDQALSALLQLVGLSPTQFDLDVGMNIIPFWYVDNTTTFGAAVEQLMQAEMGRLFMSETGRITFWNRQHYSQDIVATFDRSNTLDYTTNAQTDIINAVWITADIRQVQPNQAYWDQKSTTDTTNYTAIAPSASVIVTATFSDPVASVDTPAAGGSTSYFTANTASNGSGTDVSASVSVSVIDYCTSYQMTFTNTLDETIYITDIELYAAPATVINTIYVRQEDSASIDQYDQQLLQITNDFFPDAATVNSRALMILYDYANYNQLQTLTVKANPALEINDPIACAVRERSYLSVSGDTLSDVATAYDVTLSYLEALNPTLPHSGSLTDGTSVNLGFLPEVCIVVGIDNVLDGPPFKQVLSCMPFSPTNYFTIGISSVGGSDQVAP